MSASPSLAGPPRANPFQIEGPAVISFSGGRTSAYMLRRILDEGLSPDVHVLFANTGRERPETLQFILECQTRWDVKIHWLEYLRGEVDWAKCGIEGEPFANLITRKKFLPNPIARFCTQELKIRPMRDWMLAEGYGHWTNIVGIRADEQRRVARMRAGTRSDLWDIALPLADAGVTEAEVNDFWKHQPFYLQLGPHEGNCDLCFLKGYDKVRNIVRDRPDLAEWWAQQEERIGGTFRSDRPSYRIMLAQPDLFKDGMYDESLIECFCTE